MIVALPGDLPVIFKGILESTQSPHSQLTTESLLVPKATLEALYASISDTMICVPVPSASESELRETSTLGLLGEVTLTEIYTVPSTCPVSTCTRFTVIVP